MPVFIRVILLALLIAIARPTLAQSGTLPANSSSSVTAPWRAAGAGPRDWELLEVLIPSSLNTRDLKVSIQDLRGGPIIAQSAPAGSQRILIPLPLVQPASLTTHNWPLQLTFADTSSNEIQRSSTSVPLGSEQAATPGTNPALRIVILQGEKKTSESLNWPVPSATPPIFLEFPPEEILSGPPLLFASCDFILISPSLQPRSPAPRLTLMAAGIQWITISRDPPTGELARLVWERLPVSSSASNSGASPDPSGALWICPAQPLHRPAMIAPDLSNLPTWQTPQTPGNGIQIAVLLLGPSAIVIVLLCAGLFKRSLPRFLTCALGLMSLTVFMILYLRSADRPLHRSATWLELQAATPDSPAAGAPQLQETFTAFCPLFARNLHQAAPEDTLLWPVSRSPHEYWAQKNLQLLLGGPPPPAAATLLTGPIPAHSVQLLASSAVTGHSLLPPFPETDAAREQFARLAHLNLSDGLWLIDGYLFPGTSNPVLTPPAGQSTLFTQWSLWQPRALQDSLNAWYQLRFDARHRYFLWFTPTPASQDFHIIDFDTPQKNPL